MRIHHLALRVTSPEKSLAFYSGILGLPEVRRQADQGALRSVWLKTGDVVLMLERSIAGAEPREGSGHVLTFKVHDLTVWEARLSEAGIAVESRSAHTLYVRDPDGHRVGLSVYRL